jgi:hypothetical protein
MKNLPPKMTRRQIIQDLKGKDAFRGVTLSYTWLANQFGHFSLGFIPVIMYLTWFHSRGNGLFWTFLPGMAVWFLWFFFEIRNFYTTVTQKKVEPFFYKPRKWHFLYDLMTDLGFFGLGAISAVLVFKPDLTYILAWFVIFLLLFRESCYWYRSKIYLQRAMYPFQFRLSQWKRKKFISDENKKKIARFMEPNSPDYHLLVLGEDDDEKIHLCVGIGSELSYQLIKCRYVTTMKAFECFYRKEPEDNLESHLYAWNWHEARLLIIDDINPSHADMDEVIKTDEFWININHKFGDDNRKFLCEKKVLWMLGDEISGTRIQNDWEALLIRIGVHPENIISINLSPVK